MLQNLIYDQAPERNYEKLQELITLLIDYRLMHEGVYEEIESLLQHVYMDQDEIDGIVNDEEGYGEWLIIPDLFEREEDKRQFIEDFRNAISYCMNGNLAHNDLQAAVREIIEMRTL